MQGDADASDNKMLDRAWRGVEAMELYILAHKVRKIIADENL